MGKEIERKSETIQVTFRREGVTVPSLDELQDQIIRLLGEFGIPAETRAGGVQPILEGPSVTPKFVIQRPSVYCLS
jgi:hypothetical protein